MNIPKVTVSCSNYKNMCCTIFTLPYLQKVFTLSNEMNTHTSHNPALYVKVEITFLGQTVQSKNGHLQAYALSWSHTKKKNEWGNPIGILKLLSLKHF